ncbi:uroporphyrinogen-III C-methyltransferase [Rarobacter incanus]|uniref:uroporphyrinogen-III C-methyltransferase n=1 Tax=Rarobacter incanus TaxID=153494 RepID=A0A542SQG7_9MICO|nr:uroporphyrinogen-III C-methyltransferase [Rarobacter incanus]TQK76853.1 uroporphyrin-III C-methyltransferase [Rarobacter incanus]
MTERPPYGTVTLVGGGPGPADLITVAGARALRHAQVVLYDRLGPTDDLGELAPQAVLLDVGKLPGYHRVPQEAINEKIIESARAGKNVVRLKGGDPFVFGRGSEEVDACLAAGVPVEVIPGITSAISVPGSVGIPVTARQVARSFTVATGHEAWPRATASAYGALVSGGNTLVILMGMLLLASHVQALTAAGADGSTPVAIIHDGFGRNQTHIVSTLGHVTGDAAEHGITSPAVIVVGDVVGALAQNTGKVVP